VAEKAVSTGNAPDLSFWEVPGLNPCRNTCYSSMVT